MQHTHGSRARYTQVRCTRGRRVRHSAGSERSAGHFVRCECCRLAREGCSGQLRVPAELEVRGPRPDREAPLAAGPRAAAGPQRACAQFSAEATEPALTCPRWLGRWRRQRSPLAARRRRASRWPSTRTKRWTARARPLAPALGRAARRDPQALGDTRVVVRPLRQRRGGQAPRRCWRSSSRSLPAASSRGPSASPGHLSTVPRPFRSFRPRLAAPRHRARAPHGVSDVLLRRGVWASRQVRVLGGACDRRGAGGV
jgi:hypothetical protein